MELKHQMVPGVGRPLPTAARGIRRVPTRLSSLYRGVLPSPQPERTLRAKNDGLAIGQHLVKVKLQVVHMREIGDVPPDIVGEIRRGGIESSQRSAAALAAICAPQHIEAPRLPIFG